MAKYSIPLVGKTLSTTDDTVTLLTAATGAGSVLKVFEVMLGGEDTSSTVNRVPLSRPTVVGTTGSSAITAVKLNPASAAATFTAPTAWGTQPTLSGGQALVFAFNSFGGVVRWLAAPDSEIVVGNQGAVANLSLRSASGTGQVSGHILVEES